jgi:hypothetical protein
VKVNATLAGGLGLPSADGAALGTAVVTPTFAKPDRQGARKREGGPRAAHAG